jgi:tRNA(Ile)-lysidine synthase
VPRGASMLVAVSGGPDSMALLHVLARLREDLALTLHAHGVDHGLRAEAESELDLAEDLARAQNVPFVRTRAAVPGGGNLQARARLARYDALARAAVAVGAKLIATAHHAEDRAETVLLRLLRGAGPSGLAVLPPRAPLPLSFPASSPAKTPLNAAGIELVRPFLRARRADIEAHLARHALRFASDPSNENPRFLRVRVRREVLPLLEALSPSIVEHLCSLADALLLQEKSEAGDVRLAKPLLNLPRPTRLALAELARTRSPNARVALPGGLVATCDRIHSRGESRR